MMFEPKWNVHLDKRESAIMTAALRFWTEARDFPEGMRDPAVALMKKMQRHATGLYLADWWMDQYKSS